MDNIIAGLKRYFDSFIDEQEIKAFLLGLIDYFNYVLSNKETKEICIKLEKQRKFEYEKFEQLELKATEELLGLKNKLLNMIHKHALNLDKYKEQFKQFENYRKLKTVSSSSRPVEMSKIAFAIAKDLHENNKISINNFKPPTSLINFVSQKNLIQESEGVEIWGAFEQLSLMAKVINPDDGFRRNFEHLVPNKPAKQIELEKLYAWRAKSELKQLLDTNRNATVAEFEKLTYTGKRAVNFRNLATRLHNNIITRLEKLRSMPQKTTIHILAYEDGLLDFQGQKIEISKNKNTDPHYLLATIFKDRFKTWNYDEIHEDWGSENYDHKTDWNKYYQAGYKVNQKVAQTTTIKDFLEPTKTNVKINQKYL